jgi:hypothetical protein
MTKPFSLIRTEPSNAVQYLRQELFHVFVIVSDPNKGPVTLRDSLQAEIRKLTAHGNKRLILAYIMFAMLCAG